ncbi:hypothetical protein H6G00_12655 [Leptolyngbya sp. FACHB-541]|uniref:hypothetical protein n=1 Tax=Leptolyngbya sp. FACHB-541 TaxID=2692810 RepID=UPI001681D8BB|nr:hypothetical protein [Leptolyngbya sp. FACHB-541]MBD1997465.1 hypothetical protein [Leptolyngbya sp. FACHB-541]
MVSQAGFAIAGWEWCDRLLAREKVIEVEQMRLVYWGLAIGGFVLVVTWLWGALVAFSLILLLIIGYEIWRQSRPLALSNRSRKAKLEDGLVERSQSEVPLPDAVKLTAKPAGKLRFQLVEEKSVKHSSRSDFDQPLGAIPAQSAVGGDRTVIQEPLTLISATEADAIAEAIQNFTQAESDAALADAPTVIESLNQIHFAGSAEANPNATSSAEEPTVLPKEESKQAIAKPSRQPNPWDEPVTTPGFLNPQNNQTVIRSPAPSEPTVARPFQSQSADEPTVARPFQPNSSADEKTVIGPSKAKTGNKPSIATPFPSQDLNNVTIPKPADGSSPNSPLANPKVSSLTSADSEKITVIGQNQSPNQEEQTTL